MTKSKRRVCAMCGVAFAPLHHGMRHCPACRAAYSPFALAHRRFDLRGVGVSAAEKAARDARRRWAQGTRRSLAAWLRGEPAPAKAPRPPCTARRTVTVGADGTVVERRGVVPCGGNAPARHARLWER